MKDTLLITGGAGFIGKHLSTKLLNKYEIYILDNFLEQVHGEDKKMSTKIEENCTVIKGDVRDADLLKRVIIDKKINVIIHLAAETGTGQSMYSASRYYETNCIGTSNIIDVIVNFKTNISKFILASSRSVYGEGGYFCEKCNDVFYPQQRSATEIKEFGWDFRCNIHNIKLQPLPSNESFITSPQSIYASSKLSQEEIVRIGCKSANIDFCIFRFQNVYGPGQSLGNPYTGIISIFYNLIMQGKIIDIYEDGLESRDFVYVDDVCMAIKKCIEFKESLRTTINIGYGKRTTVLDLTNTLFKILDKKPNFKVSGKYRLGDIRHNFSDNKKLNSLLNFYPSIDLETGIQQFVLWAGNQEKTSSNLDNAVNELKEKNLLIELS